MYTLRLLLLSNVLLFLHFYCSISLYSVINAVVWSRVSLNKPINNNNIIIITRIIVIIYYY